MDFLHRRRSITLAQFEHGSAGGNDKPLPRLPGAQSTPATKMTPVENIARSRSTSSTAGGIIRRVSSIFSGRKKRPSALKLAHRNIPRIYEPWNSSSQSLSEEEDEEDDIRRPSGLGSAASFTSNRSMPPSPFTPSYNPELTSTMPFGYVRARASSTPNLLRSLSLRSRGSKKRGRPSKEILAHTTSNGSQVRLRTHNAVTVLCIPTETMAIIFSHLSRTNVAQIAHTCRLFSSASQTVLYSHVSLEELTESQLEKFIALLASRRDFTDLVRTFSCRDWPAFFLPTSPTLASPPSSTSTSASSAGSYASLDPDAQHRNTLLTATFTLAFQRMSNLTSLTLPAYDHDLLAHHTAFGLRSITFVCSTLPREEANELFAWLDGQTNVTTLLFPNLSHDCDYDRVESPVTPSRFIKSGRPATSSGMSDQSSVQAHRYLIAQFPTPPPSKTSPTTTLIPTKAEAKLSPRPKTAAPSSPSYLTTTFTPGSSFSSRAGSISLPPSPLDTHIPFPSTSANKPTNLVTTTATAQYQTSPLASLTLLPNLTTLHGPPSLIIALSPPPSSDTLHTTNRLRSRPLKSITLNISTTLYSGLRPATLVQRLNGITRNLSLCFGESVDRRTVEKMLGAVGSVLGGSRCSTERERDEKNVRGKAKEDNFAIGYKFGEGEWKGLVELDVKFVAVGGPGSDEGWHKMISSAIPRYPHLRVLRLSYTHNPRSRDSYRSSTNTLRTPNGSSPLLGNSPVLSSSPATLTPTESFGFVVQKSQTARKELSPPEKAYIRQWTKHCPHLERVVFLSGAEWWRKRK